MVECVKVAADNASTPAALLSAFSAVGMWPLELTNVPAEELSQGADRVVLDVNLEVLVSRLTPVVRKDLSCPTIVQGTLSTAERATVLTVPEVLAALQQLDADRLKKQQDHEVSRRQREAKVAAKQAKRPSGLQRRSARSGPRFGSWSVRRRPRRASTGCTDCTRLLASWSCGNVPASSTSCFISPTRVIVASVDCCDHALDSIVLFSVQAVVG